MLAGTLVTIAGFVPVGFAASSAGEYTFSLFAVVGIALIVSWFVAVVFAPLLGVVILAPPKGTQTAEAGKVIRLFQGLLTAAMQMRWVTIAVTLALFIGAFLALPLIPRQFFPSSDRPELLVDLSLPQNASIYASEAVARRFDAVLKGDANVARWSTYVGRGAIRFYLPLNVQLPNDFFAQSVIVAKDVEARERLRDKLEKVLAADFPSVIARIYPLELGPPVGWPVEYRVSGPEVAQVREIAFKLAQIVATNHKAANINFDWIEPARQLRIRIGQDEARLLGLSSQAIASALNAVITGTTITQVRDDIYLVDVIARATDEQRVSLATLRTLQVALPGGRTVPLSQFATFEYEQDYRLIWRRDRVPTLTVQADVVPGTLPETVVNALEPAIDGLERASALLQHCHGWHRRREQQIASLRDRRRASNAANHAHRADAPAKKLPAPIPGPQRGTIGLDRRRCRPAPLRSATWLRRHTGHPGAARHDHQECRNSHWPDRRRKGPREECSASRNRCQQRPIRPIMLTAVSTVLGLIPIAPTVFWGPMAFAIMGGLLIATILTLVFLPTLYVTWFSGVEPQPADPSAA